MKMYEKKRPISSLSEGEIIDDVFVVKIKKGMFEYTKGYRFILLLSDNTGKTLEYVYWGGTDELRVRSLYDIIKNDSVVHIKGKISHYGGKLQLSSDESGIIEVLDEGQYKREDFVASSEKDIDIMYEHALHAISEIKNPYLKELLEKIFNDSTMSEIIKYHPGAISIHHNWIGGLLEHSLELLEICDLVSKQFPSLNHDLLVAGALLHDIGKIRELAITSRIKGTIEGQLIGHLVLGTMFVSQKIREIDMFPEELKNKLLHIMVSHHGKNEYGSPKEPMIPEAVAVYYADEMSSKIAEMIAFIRHANEETEDDFMYNGRQGRNIYLK